MVERILRRRDVDRELRDDAREGMPRAMKVETLDARLLSVLLQILHEAVGGECLSRSPRAVVSRPQRRVHLQGVQSTRCAQIVEQSLPDPRLSDFTDAVVAALGAVLQDERLAGMHLLPTQGDGLALPQARRHKQKQQGIIALPNDVARLRAPAHRCDLLIRERLDRLGRNHFMVDQIHFMVKLTNDRSTIINSQQYYS